jgi:uncharacterized protein
MGDGDMNNKTMSSLKCILCLFGSMAMSLTVQAASFDCAKAQSKVEHLICDNPDISKLDEALSAAYKTAIRDKTKAETIKQAQKGWVLMRNNCADAECVKWTYQTRISVLSGKPTQTKATLSGVTHEEYALVMSKNDEMCNHMRQFMNDDLIKFKRTYDSHDRFVSGIEEFKAVPWQPARASIEYQERTIYTDVKGALFDFNNDGLQDFVIREEGMLSGMQADALYMLDSSAAGRANALTTKEFTGSNNQIAMAGWFYDLSAPLKGQASSLWRLSPFIYHGVSYVYMQSLYKKDEAIGGDLVVIAKYIGGKFQVREMTGKMEDICYIERVDVK